VVDDRTQVDFEKGVQGYFLIAAASLLWGTMGILAKLSYSYGISPETLIALRLVISFFTLFPALAIFKRNLFQGSRRDVPYFLVFGVFAVALQRMSYFYAVDLATATIAAILFYTYPIFVTLLASFFLREKLRPRTGLAIILTFSGVTLVVKIYDPSALNTNLAGIIFGLLSSLFFVLYFMIAKNLRNRYPTWTLILYGDGIGALTLSPIVFLSVSTIVKFPVQLWLLVFTIAWIPSLLAYALYSYALKHVKASKGSILSVLEPLSAAVLSAVIIREGLQSLQVPGIALALIGVMLLLEQRLHRSSPINLNIQASFFTNSSKLGDASDARRRE